ncbi:hypothetical protein TKK_0003757 [Trichogramma kaykai]|uniref:PRANC domain-containing protein n=1 Tax=Trichogramma kaykai TaxID=54128 RepID=A0ABD2XNJ9_9HYME
MSKFEQLKTMRAAVDWNLVKERRGLLLRLYRLTSDWEVQLPNLLDVFCAEEIDWLLMEAANNFPHNSSRLFIKFVASTGYKDKLELNEEGEQAGRCRRRTTAVHHAVRYCCEDVLPYLFKIYDRYDVNYSDESGLTHFHAACAFGCNGVVEKFLELGQDPNIIWQKCGDTPLHLAIRHNRMEVFELLLKSGVDPNLANKYDATPLHEICAASHYRKWYDASTTVYHLASGILTLDRYCNCKYVVESLLRLGADPTVPNNNSHLPLHMVMICREKCYNNVDVVKMLLEFSKDECPSKQLDARDKAGNTPLLLAVRSNKSTLVELLLRTGADQNSANKFGETPLHHICSDREDQILPNLFFRVNDDIDQRVLVNVRDNSGYTPLLLALENKKSTLVQLLLRKGADQNLANNDGETSLHFIGEYDHDNDDELVETFFEIWDERRQTTAQIDVQDKWGNTPLHDAANRGNKKVVEKLLRRGADPNLANRLGSTPLHVICKREDDDDLAAKFFEICSDIGRKVQVNVRDKKGLTPLEWAVASLLPDVVDLLLDRGADLSSFVFPTFVHMGGVRWSHNDQFTFKLTRVSAAMACVERLERRGYELDLGDALTIMRLFAKYKWFPSPGDFFQSTYDHDELAREAEEYSRDFGLSCLHDLTRRRPEETVKVLAYSDYRELARLSKTWPWSGISNSDFLEDAVKARGMHLCELMSRRFFRRWADDCFLKLIHYRLPLLCCDMIVENLTNEDLCNICLAAEGQS